MTHVETDPEVAPRTTIEEHQQTYDAFLSLTKWSIISAVILLLGMWYFLV